MAEYSLNDSNIQNDCADGSINRYDANM